MKPKEYPKPENDSTDQSKAAEAVAGYVTSPSTITKKMATERRRIAGLEASDEVWDFAHQHQLVPHLETAVRLAKESFHDPRTIDLTFEPDPEIPTLDGIGIHVKAGGTLEELLQQDRVFALRLVQEVPNEFRGMISLFFRTISTANSTSPALKPSSHKSKNTIKSHSAPS